MNLQCYRPILHVKWASGQTNPNRKRVVAIGMNPVTTGQAERPSNFLNRLCAFLDREGYDNVTLLNLFSHVAPDPKSVDPASATDFSEHWRLFHEADVILLVWGTRPRKYYVQKQAALRYFLKESYHEKLYGLKDTQTGKYPIHPSRMGRDNTELIRLNIEKRPLNNVSFGRTPLTDRDLNQISASDVMCVAVAGAGAQGDPGSIRILDKNGFLYAGYLAGGPVQDPNAIQHASIIRKLPALTGNLPSGWREAYFGMGNGFLINENCAVGAIFSAYIGQDFDQSNIYGDWGEIAREIISAECVLKPEIGGSPC